jgi:hypothetical protein
VTGLTAAYPAASYQRLFEGVTDPTSQPPNICLFLHEEGAGNQLPLTISVDIDSLCGFASSLAAFRKGFKWVSYPSRGNTIKGKIYGIYLPVLVESGEEELVPVDEVPVLYAGRLGS